MRYQNVRRHVFTAALADAQRLDRMIRDYTTPADEIGQGTFWLAADALSGYGVTDDGELIGLFSLAPGRGSELVTRANGTGATHLDCFDGYLPTLYTRHGWTETHREPNWTAGDPDVVYMRRAHA